MNAFAVMSALRSTVGVVRVSARKPWIAVTCVSASRAAGLAETLRETGAFVKVSGAVIVFH